MAEKPHIRPVPQQNTKELHKKFQYTSKKQNISINDLSRILKIKRNLLINSFVCMFFRVCSRAFHTSI